MASNVENILQATIDGTTYEVPANSRVEELLIELKEVIEAGGGGGGGTTNYNALSNKPKINNIELSGNKSLSDLSLYSKSEVDTALGNKVDKVNGKGLSENDYTDAEKTKLSNIESEANKTVVDSALSTTSTNPVQNKVINTALSGKQDTISDLETIRTGAELGATAVQPEAGKGLSTNDFTDTYKSQITTNKNGIAALVNAGAKNLLKNERHSGATITSQGATWFFSEGTMEASISGTVETPWSDVYILNSTLDLSDKEYVVVVESDASNIFVYLSGNTLSGGNIPTNGQYYPGAYRFKGIIGANARFTARTGTFDNNFLRIMICTVEDYAISPEFVPYAPTNRELFEDKTDRSEVAIIVNRGSKNLLRNTGTTQTVGGVKFTFNADGSITANGTKSNNDWLYLSVGNSLSAGTYVLSSGGVTGSDKVVVVSTADSLGSAIMTTNTDTGVYERTLTQDYTDLYYAIRIASGTVLNNVTFKPMLCTKAEWDISQEFVPYAPTNRELYEMILALQSGS